MSEKPPFDPSKPFEAVNEKPAFDPNKPFEAADVQAPSYARSMGTAALENLGSPGTMAQETSKATRRRLPPAQALEPIMRAARALDPATYLPDADSLKKLASKVGGFNATTPEEKSKEGFAQRVISEGAGRSSQPLQHPRSPGRAVYKIGAGAAQWCRW